MRSMHGGARLRVLLGLVLFVLMAVAGVFWHDLSRFADAPLAVQGQGGSIDIPRGASFSQIVARVRDRHLSAAPRWYWRVLAERMGVAKSLHAGEYALAPGLTPRRLLDRMARGDVLQHRFTIVDGWTFHELRDALAGDTTLQHAGAKLGDAQVMKRLGAEGQDPEGRFLPETYAFVKGDSDLDILARAHAAMDKQLAALWAKRAHDVPLASPYEALILASIVEKETGQPAERPRIAGVFERRLKLGMALQTDPTVIYGMGKAYDGNIRKRDLLADTPYNTYTRTGLPPTPIALPGRAAIAAALHPANGDALYFVARGDGSHVFSSTLAEHNRAVACYQLRHCAGVKR